MLITILAGGSRGDVQPYLAIGLALKRAGCSVRIVTFKNYETFVRNTGLDMIPIQGDVTMVASSEDAMASAQADNPIKVVLGLGKLRAYIYNVQKDFYAACAGSEAIIYHPALPIGYFFARQQNIPAILGEPFPMAPTREFPALIFYDAPRLGGALNRLTHKIFEQIMWQTGGMPVREFWKKEFGKVPEGFACPYGRQVTRSMPTIISCSEQVFGRPADWPEHVHLTGYWFMDEEQGWQPPEELVKFIEAGPAPVYVGFGSIGDPKKAEQTTRLVVEALQRAGRRGLLATGWSGMTKEIELPPEMHILESAPHSWLFPRMAAVVHHGGAATTAAGLRAGIPSIVIPHGNDQFAWGRRMFELGVGTRPIPRKKLTSEALAMAINSALAEKIRANASAMGQKIRAEDGATRAAEIILDCFR